MKHLEVLRNRVIRWYFVVMAGVLSVVYTGQLEIPEYARPLILAFLTLSPLAVTA